MDLNNQANECCEINATTSLNLVSEFLDLFSKKLEYVDKSLFIEEYIEALYKKNRIFFHRPQSWGKSVNLSMLYEFLNIRQDKNEELQVYNIFQKLKIGDISHQQFFNTHFAKYPCVYFDLGQLKFENSYQGMLQTFRKKILVDLYEKHKELLVKNLFFQRRFIPILTNPSIEADEYDFMDILVCAINALSARFGEMVFVFIDNYDSVVLHTPKSSEQEEKKIVLFLERLFFETFGCNNKTKGAFVMGIQDITSRFRLHFFRDIVVSYNTFNSEYATHFGFDSEEVQQLCANHGVNSTASQRQAMNIWYNGYVFGETIVRYNPYSILSFLSHHPPKLQQYYSYPLDNHANVCSVETVTIMKTFSIAHHRIAKEMITLVMKSKKYLESKLTHDDNTAGGTIPSMTVTHSLFFPRHDEESIYELITYLINAGYLTVWKITDWKEFIIVIIPNYEMVLAFEGLIRHWLLQETFTSPSFACIDELLDNLEHFERFEVRLQQLANHMHDVVVSGNTAYFQTCMDAYITFVILSATMTHTYTIMNSKNDGDNNKSLPLIILFPQKEHSNKVIIHVYQVFNFASRSSSSSGICEENDIESKVNALVEEALWQIYEEKYLSLICQTCKCLTHRHVKDVELRVVVAYTTGPDDKSIVNVRTRNVVHDMADCELLSNETLVKTLKLQIKTQKLSIGEFSKEVIQWIRRENKLMLLNDHEALNEFVITQVQSKEKRSILTTADVEEGPRRSKRKKQKIRYSS